MSQVSLGDMFHLASPDFVTSNQKRPPACGNTRGDESDPGNNQTQESNQTLACTPAPGKRRSYHDALTHCPPTGSGERLVHRWILSTANFAFREGLDADVWAKDVVTNATRPVSTTELRDAWAKAAGGPASGDFRVRRPEIKPAPLTAQAYIQRGGHANAEDFLRASPVQINHGGECWREAILLLRALFHPDEYVFLGWDQQTSGVLGKTVRTRAEWEREFQTRGQTGQSLPPLFLPNPVSPVPALTKEGKASLRCDASVISHRHAVAEMDKLPLDEQFALWWGWGLDTVSAITFSGHRSLHVLLRVDAAGSDEWERVVQRRLFDRVLIPLGCDGQCKNAGRLSRLAGAIRFDDKVSGELQKLLFVKEDLA